MAAGERSPSRVGIRLNLNNRRLDLLLASCSMANTDHLGACLRDPTCCDPEELLCPGVDAKQILATFSGTLSMLGSLYVIYQFHAQFRIQSLLTAVSTAYRLRHDEAGGARADVGTKLVTWLSLTDCVSSFFMVLGQAPIKAAKGSEGGISSFSCSLQGWSVQFFTLSTITLTTCISVNLYYWVVRGKSLRTLEKYEYKYLQAAYGPTFVLAMLLLIPVAKKAPTSLSAQQFALAGCTVGETCEVTRTSYGPAGTWCWVESSHLALLVFYLPLACCMAATFYISQMLVPRELTRRAKETAAAGGGGSQSSLGGTVSIGDTNASEEISKNAVTKLRHYGAVFFFIWFWGILNRVTDFFGDFTDDCGVDCGSPLPFQLLHVFMLPLQGFLNACVYSGLHLRLLRSFGWTRALNFFGGDEAEHSTVSDKALILDEGRGGLALLGDCAEPQDRLLFIGTWNMGEAPDEAVPAARLREWLLECPEGTGTPRDLYVIGVQECLCVDELQAKVEAVLTDANGGDPWHAWRHALGSDKTDLGYHGFIALLVFVRASDVAAGDFESTGKSDAGAELARGKNIGMKRTANKGAAGMAFRYFDTTLAFASVHLASDAGDGSAKVQARNTDAAEIIRFLKIDMEDVEVDWPLLHHHAFFFGDLNYRITMAPIEALEATVAATCTDQGWGALHGRDELTTEMAAKRAFCGFAEASEPTFGPTYRRVRDSDPGNYDDITVLNGCYTLAVQRGKTTSEDGDEVPVMAPRTPSWCDRVLCHSNAGKASRLRLDSYNLCDSLKASDHVPVSAVYKLRLDTAHPSFASSGGGKGGRANRQLLRQVQATIVLSDMVLDTGLGEPLDGLSAYRTVFPLPAEVRSFPTAPCGLFRFVFTAGSFWGWCQAGRGGSRA